MARCPPPSPIPKGDRLFIGQGFHFMNETVMVVDFESLEPAAEVTLLPLEQIKRHYEENNDHALMPRPIVCLKEDVIDDPTCLEYRPRDLPRKLEVSPVTFTRIIHNYPRDLPRDVGQLNDATVEGQSIEEAGIREHHRMIHRFGENLRRVGWHYFGDESEHAALMQIINSCH